MLESREVGLGVKQGSCVKHVYHTFGFCFEEF